MLVITEKGPHNTKITEIYIQKLNVAIKLNSMFQESLTTSLDWDIINFTSVHFQQIIKLSDGMKNNLYILLFTFFKLNISSNGQRT